MNVTQKIYLNPNAVNVDKHIKIKLEQEVNTLEFLSLKLKSNDIYQSFNADYGVLVGRVIANNGIGVPNAKVSIFIPLADDDEANDDIRYIYPYKTPRDKNTEGKRYNLLPRVGVVDPSTNIIHPNQPFGSFPIKEEIVSNINQLNVYKKYYKYTALTNEYGDYMIFGTPIGTQIIHMSLDITDIGKYSMTPASMVTNLGYSPNLFKDNNTRVKESNDLNDLPHIETQEISIDIIPFWGDSSNYEIGITRQDFRVKLVLNNTVTIFGSAFTDKEDAMWGANNYNGSGSDQIRARELSYIGDSDHLDITTKRSVTVNESIYYYPAEITDYDIEHDIANEQDMLLLDKSEYSRYFDSNGSFVFIINCNRKKQVVNNQNETIDVANDFNGGIFTEFKGFIVFETDETIDKMTALRYLDSNLFNTTRGRVEPFRYKLKFPQYSETIGDTFNKIDSNPNTINWKKTHFTFKSGEIYSVGRFHGMCSNTNTETFVSVDPITGLLTGADVPNSFLNPFDNNNSIDPNYNVGIIEVPASGDTSILLVPNYSKYFGAEWLNMSIYFPQIGELKNYVENSDGIRSSSHFTRDLEDDPFFYTNNDQEIAGGYLNTKWFGRSDINQTTFIRVTKEDINKFIDEPNGFIKLSDNNSVSGSYSGTTNTLYFYKGFGGDCVKYLKQIGIV